MANDIELIPVNLGSAANPVRVIQHIEDKASALVSVEASATLATLLGSALDDRIAAVTLIVDPAATVFVHYNPDGAATGSNAAIFAGGAYIAFGNKAKLDAIQLFATGATNVSVFQHTLI